MTEEELREAMGSIIYKHQGGFAAINPLPIPIHTKRYCVNIADELLTLIREAGYRSIEEMADLHEKALGSAIKLLKSQGWKSPEEVKEIKIAGAQGRYLLLHNP